MQNDVDTDEVVIDDGRDHVAIPAWTVFASGLAPGGAEGAAHAGFTARWCPLGLFRSRNVSVSLAVGFAFVVGYYGLPFVMSLYLRQSLGLSSFTAGLVFMATWSIRGALPRESSEHARKSPCSSAC
jgi:O-antigen ligase